MKPARRPADETRRLEALRQFSLLDANAEPALDELTALAAHLCDAPISLVSLIDEKRQWFKSARGLSISEIPRELSFCAHTILEPDLLVVPDAASDDRFADNPLVVDDPRIRFYAGVPLLTSGGNAIGTLCVIDRTPRQLSTAQLDALRVLGRQVMAQFDLRRRNRELLDSEARLLTVFRSCPVGLAIHRWSDRIFVDVNAAFTDLLGWTREELVGRTAVAADLVDDARAELLRQQLQATGKLRNAEVALRTRTGGIRHVVIGSEIVELRGEPHTITTFLDVDERWKAQQSLRDGEERLRLALDAAHMGIFDWDIPARRITWSRWHEKLWGFGPGEFDGSYEAFAARVHPDDLPALNDDVARCIASRQPFIREFRVIRPDGNLHWIAGRGEFTFDGDGQPIRMRGAVIEITALKQAEAGLSASEARYRALFEHAPDGILVTDRRGYGLDANASFLRMTGYTAPEIRRLRGSDLVAPQLAAEFAPALAEVLAAGDSQREWSLRRKDGSTFDADVRVTAMPDGSLLAMVHDVTARKEGELRIQRLNRMYAMLSRINEVIVREREPQAMLAAACRIAVETGQFLMAWIGLVDPRTGRMDIAAHAGATDDVLELVRAFAGGDAQGSRCLITAGALGSGESRVCNDIANDPRAVVWRDAALQQDYRAMASLPLKADGVVTGVFNLYAGKTGVFDIDELRLLDELAMDVGFALAVGRLEEARRAADERHAAQRNALVGLTGRQTLAGRDLTSTLQEITEAAARTLGVARVSIWRYSADGSAMTCVDRFEIDSGCHTSGETLDAAADPHSSELRDDSLTANGLGARLDVPVHVRGRLHGVLCHEHVGSPRDWAPDERTFAVAMANLVSLALESWERGEAERARRDSEERFREIAENIQEAFWMTDSTTNRVLYVSPVYERIWGRSRASLYETPLGWLEAIHPDDRPRLSRALEARGAGAGYDEVYRILRPDGSIRWIHDRAFPVRDASGEARRIVGAAEDITERRQLEEQFRQSQKMDAIGQLAGGVAHDFNNLLTIIHGYSAMLLESNASEELEQIVLASERAAGLTRQLLAFSRRQVMQSQVLDLNEVVTNIAKLLQRVLGEDVRLQLSLAPSPLMTTADVGMLDQVLLNLAVNARDAMPDGGQLAIETAARTLTAEQARAIPDAEPGEYVSLRVADTGRGIAPGNLSRIFEPFFTTKEPGKGTGLGLATVFGIVKQHGGSITVESEPGCGATFEVLLRAAPLGAVETSDAVTPPLRRGTETILLVEDEPGVRMLARVVLERNGYRVLEASHGVEALRILEQEHASIDLLLTDLVMPEGVSGGELAARVRAVNPRIKVIFTSGYSAETAGRELSLREGQDFLQKPFSPRLLLDAIRRSFES